MIFDHKKNIITPLSFIYLALLTFNIEAANIDFNRDKSFIKISIDGEIKDGDYLKFKNTITKSFSEATAFYQLGMETLKKDKPEEYKKIRSKTGNIGAAISVKVLLNSNGGNLTEAIKIGKAIRNMTLSTETGSINKNDFKCISACFFIWVAGIEKDLYYNKLNQTLGIHRIYFQQEKYKELPSNLAEQEYLKIKDYAIDYLLNMGVSKEIINKSFRTPSNDVYFLSKEDIETLEGTVPYYDELLISRCGSYSKKEMNDYLQCKIIYPKENNKRYNLKATDRNNLHKKCSSLPSGYLELIEKKVTSTIKCRNMNSAIEQWKRMAIFLSLDHLIPK